MPKLPNTFVIGAPKCATTSLVNALGLHPDIYVPFIKEPGYFGSDVAADVGGWDDYRQLYAQCPSDARVIVDGSTQYLASRDAVSQILEFAPEARMVCAFRDPLDVAPAFHAQLRRHHAEPLASFDEAWADQTARRRRMAEGGEREPLYAELCMFGEQLERLFAQVNREHVHIVFFDELVSEPRRVLGEVQSFLDVPYTDLALPKSNENREVVHEGIHRIKMALAGYARRLKQRIGIRRNLGLMRGAFAFTTRATERSPPKPETIEAMKAAFAEDMALFERMAGRSVRGALWSAGNAGPDV